MKINLAELQAKLHEIKFQLREKRSFPPIQKELISRLITLLKQVIYLKEHVKIFASFWTLLYVGYALIT